MARKKSSQEQREIGGRIRTLRKEQKMKQQTLADMIGIPSRSTISDIERGQRRASTAVLKAMAQVFQVSVGYLVGDTASQQGESPETLALKARLRSEVAEMRSCLERVTMLLEVLFILCM